MQKPFYAQPELFTTSADLEHSSLQGLDGAKAVLDWAELERLMAVIYASKTGRPSYPLLVLSRLRSGPSAHLGGLSFESQGTFPTQR